MRVVLGLAAALLVPAALAQTGSTERLTTFLDCPGYVPGCDRDFFQTEVGFVRFVRDPADAAVYVLAARESTGGGGDRYTLFFEGRRGTAAGRRDTLVATVPPAASDDDQRRALLSRLALGLAGFASRTGIADRLSIAYDSPSQAAIDAEAEEVVDPWNSWVFRLNGNGFFNGQAQSQSGNLSGSFSASRVTEEFKVNIRPRANYNFDVFRLPREDGTDSTVVSDNVSYALDVGAVKSLGPHWSVGGRLDLLRNTFSNIDGRVRVGPAVEYSVFPYAEFTERQVTAVYSVGLQAVAYQDTTVLGETSEVLGQHELGVGAEFAQAWGSVDVYSGASQYLAPGRFDKYNLSIGGGVDLRLVRGLSLRVDGRYEFVRDQIGLRADRASDGEILTGQFELATGYSYFASVGLSYSFGSIFNQVVNPRL